MSAFRGLAAQGRYFCDLPNGASGMLGLPGAALRWACDLRETQMSSVNGSVLGLPGSALTCDA